MMVRAVEHVDCAPLTLVAVYGTVFVPILKQPARVAICLVWQLSTAVAFALKSKQPTELGVQAIVVAGGHVSTGALQSPTCTWALHVAVWAPWLTVRLTGVGPSA